MSSISNSNRSKNTSTRKRRGKKTKTKRVSKELLMKQDSERKMLQLQQQLMFLRWRKCQTGAKMRKILADSKRFKNMDVSQIAEQTSQLEDRSSWMQEVVESEKILNATAVKEPIVTATLGRRMGTAPTDGLDRSQKIIEKGNTNCTTHCNVLAPAMEHTRERE